MANRSAKDTVKALEASGSQPSVSASETPKPQPQTEEQKADQQARVEKASEAIKAILVEHRCILTVPTLDISTGRVFPQIQLRAQP